VPQSLKKQGRKLYHTVQAARTYSFLQKGLVLFPSLAADEGLYCKATGSLTNWSSFVPEDIAWLGQE
jgi:hypothetical protein